jgi:hypothetical protein
MYQMKLSLRLECPQDQFHLTLQEEVALVLVLLIHQEVEEMDNHLIHILGSKDAEVTMDLLDLLALLALQEMVLGALQDHQDLLALQDLKDHLVLMEMVDKEIIGMILI